MLLAVLVEDGLGRTFLGSEAVPLAAGLVDALEERTAWVVEGEEVDEADVLQHLGRPVAREGIVVSEDREQRRNRVGAHTAKGILGGGAYPPALVGEEPRDGRRRVRAHHVARGSRGVNSHEPLAVVETRDESGSDCRSTSRSERLDGGGTHVWVGVPRELDEGRLTQLGVGSEQRRAPEADGGVPVVEQREKLRAGRGSEPLELRGNARVLTAAAPERVKEEIDGPVVPDVSERADRSGRDHRIRVVEYGLDQARDRGMVRLFETLQRANATPPPPLAARTSSRASNEALCSTIAQWRGEAAASPVEAKPPQQNRQRQRDPGRECDDEHGKSNAENKRVHPVVVVVPESGDVPRSRDPTRRRLRSPQLAMRASRLIRVSRRRAEVTEGGVTVLSTGPRPEWPQRGERAAEPGSARRERRPGKRQCG